MHHDILTTKFNSNGGNGSKILMAYEMICGETGNDSDNEKIAEEEFAALCEVIESEG